MDPDSTPKGAKCLKHVSQQGVTAPLSPSTAVHPPQPNTCLNGLIGPLIDCWTTLYFIRAEWGMRASAPAAVHDWLLIARISAAVRLQSRGNLASNVTLMTCKGVDCSLPAQDERLMAANIAWPTNTQNDTCHLRLRSGFFVFSWQSNSNSLVQKPALIAALAC